MSLGLTYEFEDVLADLLDLRIVSPVVPTDDRLRRVVWRGVRTPRLMMPPAGSLTRPELVVAVAQNLTHLMDHLPEVQLIDRARTTVAYVQEVWPRELPPPADVRAMLNRFDHVAVGSHRSAEVLAPLLRTSVSYLPPAVDVMQFVSGAAPPRDIDVYAMGRRNAALHEVLLERELITGRFYLYDTFRGNPEVHDYREHRHCFAGLVRRSNVFVVNASRVDEPHFNPADSDIAFRYFEGVAGGAVLLGVLPSTHLFAELFPWAEPVVRVAADGSDLVAVLDELDADPERVARIRVDNVTGALRHHDVAHRAVTLLNAMGLEIPNAVSERLGRLAELARQFGALPPSSSSATSITRV